VLGLEATRGSLRGANKAAAPKAAATGGDNMLSDWAVIGVILAIGAVSFGFPAGAAVGYAWRAHISRVRRVRYLTERERRRATLDGVGAALARNDI
jgi:adenine/guanine phosphoribosyltransferase-like PRPP-binding protein